MVRAVVPSRRDLAQARLADAASRGCADRGSRDAAARRGRWGASSAEDLSGTENLGLNYYLCGHHPKLQFGLEHLGLEGPRPGTAIPEADFWSYQSAVKVFF